MQQQVQFLILRKMDSMMKVDIHVCFIIFLHVKKILFMIKATISVIAKIP